LPIKHADSTPPGPFGNWKPYDDDAKPEAVSPPPWKKRKRVEESVEELKEETDSEALDEDITRLEAFAGVGQAANTPPDTPAVSIKVKEETSDSELSSAKSMESIEFDESFSSGAHSATPAPAEGANSMADQLSSSPLIPEAASPYSSPYKLRSVSPTSSQDSSRSGKSLSKIRKECMHCGTIATADWMNGPTPQRNRCQNPSCSKPRDRY
jgi:hypothetical protein